MWVACGALVFANAFIGLAEGWLLARAFRVSVKKAGGLMIAANYLSGIAGYWLLPEIAEQADANWFSDPRLFRAALTLGVLVGLSFVMTVAIELPFVLLVTKPAARSLEARLAAGIWVQAVSYAALAVIYFPVS